MYISMIKWRNFTLILLTISRSVIKAVCNVNSALTRDICYYDKNLYIYICTSIRIDDKIESCRNRIHW